MPMNEDWLKDIHDKMASFEADEPQNLWSDICRAQRRAKIANAVRMQWTRRAAAVAAMLVLMLLTVIFMKQPPEMPVPGFVALNSGILPSETPDGSRGEADNKTPMHYAATMPSTTADEEPGAAVTEESCSVTLPEKAAVTDDATEDTIQTVIPRLIGGSDGYSESVRYIAQANAVKNSSKKFSFGVYMNGSSGSVLNNESERPMSNAAVVLGPDNSSWNDSPILGILLYGKGQEVKTDIKHHLPVRTGVSLAYNVSDRISIVSGIIYTYLKSDMSEVSDGYYFTGEQNLHYIGIPVNVRYRALSWKGVELYGSAGVAVEKCVSGYLKKNYVMNNMAADRETKDKTQKPIQLSATVSAGVQYNVSSAVGLYAEPGVSYHFDDGTDLKTVYKDKPLNFSLNVGLRFTFGDK